MDYKQDFFKIVTKAVTMESAKRNVTTDDIRLQMYLTNLDKKKPDAAFKYMQRDGENFNPDKKELDFKDDILDVRFDLKGISYFVPVYIRKALLRLAGKFGIAHNAISVMMAYKGQQVYIFLFNGHDLVKRLEFEDVVTSELAEQAMQEEAVDQMREDQEGS